MQKLKKTTAIFMKAVSNQGYSLLYLLMKQGLLYYTGQVPFRTWETVISLRLCPQR